MKKPGFQWRTRRHRARRLDGDQAPSSGAAGAQAFALEFSDGHRGRANLSLERQEVDARSASDPDLLHAVCCWLVARGQRRVNLWTDGGAPVEQGAVELEALGSPRPGARPERVVTLAPSCLEVVHAVGAIERVVGCEDSSDLPADVGALPRLGPDLGPDLDAVQALEPELVVSSLTVPGMERVVTGLRARGVPQQVLAPRTLDEIAGDLERVAGYLHAPEAGARARAEFQAQRRAVAAAASGPPVPTYLEWWPRPMFTPGRDCYSNEVLALAGARNVFRGRPGASVEVTPADLERAAPRLALVSWCGVRHDRLEPERLLRRPGVQRVPAVQGGHVYALDEALIGRPGPRVLVAARQIAAHVGRLHGAAPRDPRGQRS